jgi:hypothetical protein
MFSARWHNLLHHHTREESREYMLSHQTAVLNYLFWFKCLCFQPILAPPLTHPQSSSMWKLLLYNLRKHTSLRLFSAWGPNKVATFNMSIKHGQFPRYTWQLFSLKLWFMFVKVSEPYRGPHNFLTYFSAHVCVCDTWVIELLRDALKQKAFWLKKKLKLRSDVLLLVCKKDFLQTRIRETEL